MPDEGRERVFPEGIVVRMISQEDKLEGGKAAITHLLKNTEKKEVVATDAEGKLNSEAEVIKEQALQSRSPEGGNNLLKKSP